MDAVNVLRESSAKKLPRMHRRNLLRDSPRKTLFPRVRPITKGTNKMNKEEMEELRKEFLTDQKIRETAARIYYEVFRYMRSDYDLDPTKVGE